MGKSEQRFASDDEHVEKVENYDKTIYIVQEEKSITGEGDILLSTESSQNNGEKVKWSVISSINAVKLERRQKNMK